MTEKEEKEREKEEEEREKEERRGLLSFSVHNRLNGSGSDFGVKMFSKVTQCSRPLSSDTLSLPSSPFLLSEKKKKNIPGVQKITIGIAFRGVKIGRSLQNQV